MHEFFGDLESAHRDFSQWVRSKCSMCNIIRGSRHWTYKPSVEHTFLCTFNFLLLTFYESFEHPVYFSITGASCLVDLAWFFLKVKILTKAQCITCPFVCVCLIMCLSLLTVYPLFPSSICPAPSTSKHTYIYSTLFLSDIIRLWLCFRKWKWSSGVNRVLYMWPHLM